MSQIFAFFNDICIFVLNIFVYHVAIYKEKPVPMFAYPVFGLHTRHDGITNMVVTTGSMSILKKRGNANNETPLGLTNYSASGKL